MQESCNPYWERLQNWPGDDMSWDGRRRPSLSSVPYENPDSTPRQTRWEMCSQYAYSIPDPASVEFVAKHLGSRAVEIGAGTGYYASMLARIGTQVICYDSDPPHRSTQNHWFSPRKPANQWQMYGDLAGFLRPVYQEVYYGGPGKAARYTCPLFLCWPPMSSMAYKALKCYAGSKLVYIGEGGGGCTADEAFFALLDKQWHEVDEHTPVQWSCIHDYITVYERSV